jgi:hypothetical protein
MFYMPKYHNLPDGRQVFLRFPDPARHALPVSRLLQVVPSGEVGEEYLRAVNADPQRLVLLAEIGDNLAACGLLELSDCPKMQVAVAETYRGLSLEQLIEDALRGVAAQKGFDL